MPISKATRMQKTQTNQIPPPAQQLVGAELAAQKLDADFIKLLRLVKHHGIHGRQQFSHTSLAHIPVCKELTVPTLQGEALVKVPAETQTGKMFRLRGKGVKSVRSHAAGDLLVRVVVETPVNLTAKQRELLTEFESTFAGEEGAKHSPKSSTFFDGVKSFLDRMMS